MKITTELFLLPDQNGYMLFAPLKRVLVRSCSSHVNLLASIQAGTPIEFDPENPFLVCLRDAEVLDGPGDNTYEISPVDNYKPTRTTLFLTSKCNLACAYCYANANAESLTMPIPLGRAAIDYAAANAVERGLHHLEVGFHGGGEPTVAWRTLQALTRYAHEAAGRHSLTPQLSIATNGCFSTTRAHWIAQHLNSACISMDGLPTIQDRQRPLLKGGASSPLLLATLRAFEELKFTYAIQATFTAETFHEMPEAVRWLAENTNAAMVKFEPVSATGRYHDRSALVPEMQAFGQWFNRAYDLSLELGVSLGFSGIRLWGETVRQFCGAFLEPFSVTPDGYVTACYEAYSAKAEYAGTFFIGRYDPITSTFFVDHEKLKELRRRNVSELAPCKKCFCKYSCGGDCATRNFRALDTRDLTRVGARCEAIRSITRHRLSRYLERACAQAGPDAATAGRAAS